jgi:large subunit ribosomal protein L22
LRFSSKEASRKLEKLVLSVIANWRKPEANMEEGLFKTITVDGGMMLKRLRPAQVVQNKKTF